MATENKTLVLRWFEEVWNKGRASAVDEMLAENGVVHGLGSDLHGPAEFKSVHTTYKEVFPDIRFHIDELVEEGPLVAARWSAVATHLGDGLGVKATGKRVHMNGMIHVRVEHGKVAEGWNNFDELGMLKQIGAIEMLSSV